MYVAYTAEQEALRQELRGYFAELMTPEVQAECAVGDTGGPACLEAVRKMGRDGWLGIGWPKEYGGQGRTDIEQFIFINEAWRAGAPIPFLTINTVGRTIMEFGSEEQKQFFLPKILAGELHFSIGYTEPNAGTDLASLTTRAVQGRRRVGDQRPEDLHVARQLRRLHLAGRPHRPRRAEARRHHDLRSCPPPIPGSRTRRSTRW